jgi:hypothetical protein
VFYKVIKGLIVILIISFVLASCQSVKPYQRIYLDDHFMKLGAHEADAFGEKALTYREGSAGGGTGKSSGGCGCN